MSITLTFVKMFVNMNKIYYICRIKNNNSMKFIRPNKMPEANIQAEIYRLCRNEGINICLEYTFNNCRFDAVIIKNGEIIAIVETKSRKKVNHKRLLKTKQLLKYLSFGIPVILCASWNEIESAFYKIKELYK